MRRKHRIQNKLIIRKEKILGKQLIIKNIIKMPIKIRKLRKDILLVTVGFV